MPSGPITRQQTSKLKQAMQGFMQGFVQGLIISQIHDETETNIEEHQGMRKLLTLLK